MIPGAEAGRRRVNLADAFCYRGNGFVHYHVFRRLDDFESGNAAVFFDSNFHECRNFDTGSDGGGRLNPGAVKTVVQHIAIPAELRCVAPAARVPNFAF
jgi:hypothetical protein